MTAKETRRKRGRRIRLKSHKRLDLFLLAMGLTGIIAGMSLILIAMVHGNRDFTLFGSIYIIVAVTLLFLRMAMKQFYNARKRKYANRL